MILASLTTAAQRLLRARRCVAALEFALLSPAFIAAFAGIVDLGSALYTWSRLEGALAVGANYALTQYASSAGSTTAESSFATSIGTFVSQSTFVNPTTGAGTGATVTVVVNNGVSITFTAGVAGTASGTLSTSCYCPTGAPTSWTWGSAVACGSSCAATGGTAGKFVTITASQTFTPFFPAYHFVTGTTMSDGVMVQTQ